jgi:uncharacterized OB-fold protein
MVDKTPIKEGLFIEEPDGAVLTGNKCKACGRVFFPKAEICLDCLHEKMEEVKLSRKGELFAYTTLHMPVANFKPPCAVGYVDLPEGVRIFAPIDIVEEKPFKVGMNMEMYIDTLWKEEDKEVVGYRFAPI